MLLDDDGRVAADRLEPLAELLGVAHRGRQRDQPDRLGQRQDDLFPDTAAEAVGQVVHLVHHDVAEAAQRVRAGVEHVAQHFGGHDDDRRVAVAGGVAGQQPDLVGAVAGGELGELLVGQRLDRRRVEALAAAAQRPVGGELADHRLPGAGRRGDQHAAALGQRAGRPAAGTGRGRTDTSAANAATSAATLRCSAALTSQVMSGCTVSGDVVVLSPSRR